MTDPRNDPSRDQLLAREGSISTGLLGGLRAQDAGAWRRLSQLYGPEVHRWCVQKGLQDEDAADVVQEVFQTVLLRLNDFRRDRPKDTFRGWMWTITRNKLGDFYRRRARRAQAVGGTDAFERWSEMADRAPESSGDDTPPGSSSGLYRRALEMIRAEFEASTWDAFYRSAVQGCKPADVAAELTISVNAVYLAKSRVLRRLREELGDVLE